MSQTLYRKYRPKKFDEVVGQDHVISILKNALKDDKISHAYIFAGSRGIGKTSIARIFAEALGTSSNDTYEIDAASNRGIDDIRAVREAVNTLPFESRFKVYIIDEAHMLTKEAWNALLKTLEEPPAHVIFILATTEASKIPETILSRCEVHSFKRPTNEILRDVISKTAKKEGVILEPDAADLIATLADGSFRDAHGILQKIINTGVGKTIGREEAEEYTGAPKMSLAENFIESIAEKNIEKGLEVLRTVSKQNLDVTMFSKIIIETLRGALLLKASPMSEKELKEKLSPERFTFVKKISEIKDSAVKAETLRELLTAHEEISRSFIPTLPLEIALIKVLS